VKRRASKYAMIDDLLASGRATLLAQLGN